MTPKQAAILRAIGERGDVNAATIAAILSVGLGLFVAIAVQLSRMRDPGWRCEHVSIGDMTVEEHRRCMDRRP